MGINAEISPPEQVLPAGVVAGENEYGRVFFKDEYFPLDHLHGDVRLDSAFEVDDVLLGRLGSGLSSSHIRNAAYLDIETTGLSGSVEGAFAFIVGVGTFDGLAFRVRQYFLTDLRGEPAMLAALSDTLARCSCIVTFNGKTFDLPQLTARYELANQRSPFDLPHIDLLHPARKLYKRSLPTCRLAEVERRLLGLKRFGDIAGSLIPDAYLAYVRRRNARRLPPLFEHNSLDVLSLVAFLGYLSADAGALAGSSALHHLALGKWDESVGNRDAAIQQYRKVLAVDPTSELGGEAALRLSRLLRRQGGWRPCLELWQQELATTTSAVRRVRACVELAKLFENRMRCPADALDYAQQALAAIDAASLRAFFAVTRPALEIRIARLRRVVDRARAPDGPGCRRRSCGR